MNAEILGWIGGILILMFVIVPIIAGAIWGPVSFFLRFSHWKKCAFRSTEPSCGVKLSDILIGKGCQCCPLLPDERQRQAYLDKLQELQELVDQYAEKNRKG